MWHADAFQLPGRGGGAALPLMGAVLTGWIWRIGLPDRLPGQSGGSLAMIGGDGGMVMWVGAVQPQGDLVAAALNAGKRAAPRARAFWLRMHSMPATTRPRRASFGSVDPGTANLRKLARSPATIIPRPELPRNPMPGRRNADPCNHARAPEVPCRSEVGAFSVGATRIVERRNPP